MDAELKYTVTAAGALRFGVEDLGAAVPLERWATLKLASADGTPVRPGVLLRLYGEETASLEGHELVVPARAITKLTDAELRSLGFPPRVALSLEVRAQGEMTEPDFFFEVVLRHTDGRPAIGWTRRGPFLSLGERRFVLTPELLAAIESVEEFGRAAPAEVEARIVAWARIRALLPEGTKLDSYLAEFRVATTARFTLRPFINHRGEPDFDPVPFHPGDREEGGEILPSARQDDFARYFRRRKQVQRRYAVGGGWYLVLTEPVRRALEVVRECQGLEPEARRRFLRNPRLALRDALEEELGEELLETLFAEEEFSSRVRAVGLWTPCVVPWIQPASNPWLPPEQLGLRLGEQLVLLEPEEVPPLAARLREALQRGETSLEVKTVQIPVDEATLAAVDRIASALPPPEVCSDNPEASAVPEFVVGEEPVGKIALQIKTNLEILEHAAKRRRRGAVGSRPSLLKTRLLPHQEACLDWLAEHWASGSPGALLADDMGLGKTLSALAFLAWLRELQEAGTASRLPLLVVAPTGLLKNWRDEHERHLQQPGIGLLVQGYGPGLRELRVGSGRSELQTGLPVLDVGRLQNAAWVMTTYETLRDYQHSFGRVRWACVVFDEAQKIKNPAAGMTDAAKALNAEFTLALTGTPVENRLADLWCIADTAWPGRLGTLKEFVATYERGGTPSEDGLKALKSTLTEKPVPVLMLRRMKEGLLSGLPEREQHVVRVAMPERQAAEYARVIQAAKRSERGQMLMALQRMRQVSLHPLSWGETLDENVFVRESARLRACMEILDQIASRSEKALVFADDLEIQGALVELLQLRYRLPRPPLVINGSVSGDKRKARVDEFQSGRGFDVMLLSPRAGGVGLTLTAANHVIHLSRWWNPAVEDQCNDRIYRIGQQRKVHVYLPLAVHPAYGDASFDIRLHELLERKRSLSRTLLAPPGADADAAAELFAATVAAA